MKIRVVVGGLLALLGPQFLAPLPLALGQSPPAPVAPKEAHALAKEMFDKGLRLLDANLPDRALGYFLQSRAALPSIGNTTNAAICLEQLGRYDEALEMYEELLVQFSEQLGAEEGAAVAAAMRGLRKSVGSVTLSSNVKGTVVVDGRKRGVLPLSEPIPLTAGKHVVRLLEDGYRPFERAIDVAAGSTLHLEANLTPLTGAGMLRIEDVDDAVVDVYVDGALLGVTPWEGLMPLGRHVVWTRKGDRGSAPRTLVVIQGQTASARVRSAELGPTVRVEVSPSTADLFLDDVSIGEGRWEGRLPAGQYRLTASETGYHASSRLLQVRSGGVAVTETLRLDVDAQHPRWPRSVAGRYFVSVLGGYAIGRGLGADAEDECPGSCQGSTTMQGFVAGLRGGYRFRWGIAPEVTAGYASFGASFGRTLHGSFRGSDDPQGPHLVRYQLSDDITVRGPFLGAGVSLRRELGRLGISTRATLGLLFARSADPVTGTATTRTGTAVLAVENREQVEDSQTPFVMPEVGIDVAVGPLQLGIGLGLALFPLAGPKLDHAQAGVAPACSVGDDPESVGCVPNSAAIADERVHGRFVVWIPQASITYPF